MTVSKSFNLSGEGEKPGMNEFEKGLKQYLTVKQLEHIQGTKVGIAGAGGLGSNLAHALVRCGFRDFTLIDNDRIEASNLNRQNYYLDEIGFPKVEMLSKRLKQINPGVLVQTYKVWLNADNVMNYFEDRDILLEAFDGAESKKMFLEAFRNSSKLVILGSGMAGFDNSRELKIRSINENLFIVGDGITSVGNENPPFAPRVMACAALMASVVLEWVLKSSSGKN